MTNRQEDGNGFIRIPDNPIAKEGIKKYMGYEIGADDPNKVYNVYIPAEELSNPEFIDALKNLPIIDGHVFIGDDEDAMPAERKGVQGTLGEQVYFDSPYLKANINIYSSSLKSKLDPNNPDGYKDLSLGYKARYEFIPGIFNGVRYDAIQRFSLPNHIAVVPEGRSGKDVAVLDHNTINQKIILTYDSAENLYMADENEKEAVRARLTDALDKLKDMDQAERDELLKPYGIKFSSDEDTTETEDEDETKTEDEGEGEETAAPEKTEDEGEAEETKDESEKETMDATNKRIKALEAQVKKLSEVKTQDAVIKEIAGRDALVSKVTPFIGTFDHASMTKAQVAAYTAKKLGLKVQAGQEEVAINAYMHGRVPESQQKTYQTQDSKPSEAVTTAFSEWESK